MNAAISPGVSGVRTESLKGAGASAWGPAGTGGDRGSGGCGHRALVRAAEQLRKFESY